MGRTIRTVEEKKRILQELDDWRATGGTIQQFALDQGIERKNLYTWEKKYSEKPRIRKRKQHLPRMKEFVEVRSGGEEPEAQRYVVSVPVRIIGSGVRVELSAGCRKEDLELIISSMGERS